MELPEHGHEPVLLKEVLEFLAPAAGKVVADCTVGRGGHAGAIAEKMFGEVSSFQFPVSRTERGKILALDVDPTNLKYARERLAGYGEAVRFFHANFGEIDDVVDAAELGRGKVLDGLLADLGVSTNQLMEARHGMSFTADGPLDMRMDPRIKESASDLLARLGEAEIARVLQDYAQERFAWRIARKIVSTRATVPIRTTDQLARLVRSVVPGKWGQIDPATRTFQALRMAVNAELEVLEDLLAAVPALMKPKGRVVIISFHSGEDRLVKHAMRAWQAQGLCEVLTRKPVEAGEDEARRNPRSRSAKLRAAEWK
jgi:16S rRNA (cytosine1402-N4)-methyltransferase